MTDKQPMPHAKSSAIKNMVQFTTSNFYRHILGLATAFFRPGLLGPELFGIWSLLNVIPFYANFAHLGTRSAMRFKIAEVENQAKQQVAKYKHTTLAVTAVFTALLMLGIVTYAMTAQLALEMEIGLYAIAVIIAFNALYEHYCAEAKGHHNFTLVSQATVIRYTLNFVFCIVFIWFWGLYGALLALGLSCALALGFVIKKTDLQWPRETSLPLAKSTIKDGSPIMALDLVNLTLRNIDKVLVAWFLGATALGMYAIAGILVGVMINIPGSSREVTEQLLMAENKKVQKAKVFDSYFIQSTRLNAFLMPIVIAVMCFSLPVFVTWFLPAFNSAVEPAQWLLIGAFFLTLSYPARGIIVFNNWQKTAAVIALIPVAFSAIALYTTLSVSTSLNQVTVAASASFCLLFLTLYWFVCHKYEVDIKRVTSEAVLLFIPFIVLVLCYFVSTFFTKLDYPILLLNLVSGIFFLLVYLPLLFYVAKRNLIKIPEKVAKKFKLNKVLK